jgi:UDP-3-O-[3-hydroxymyristoyl] N-acetylglucosamine deacetylase
VQQSTIARRVACSGTGLHSGEEVEIALCPAPAGTGIVFVSLGAADDGRDVEISASVENVLSTSRATTLASISAPTPTPTSAPSTDAAATIASPAFRDGGSLDPERVKIATVEHLLAALFALEIDNVRVEVKGSEIPALDGSAARFVEWIRLAGRQRQNADRRELAVVEEVEIRDGDRWIRIEPADALRISYAIDFAHPCIGRQSLEISSFDEKIFEREFAAARTFGFAHEVEALREAGLARGGNLENSIVLDDTSILNSGSLGWRDEFVRHKVIDLVGDLALLGASLHAHVRVEKGGHGLHHRLVQTLADRPELLEDRTGGRSISRRNPPVRVLAQR